MNGDWAEDRGMFWATILLIVLLVALILVPLVPWATEEEEFFDEKERFYYGAGDFVETYPGMPDEFKSIRGDLIWVKLSYWIALLFVFFALVGAAFAGMPRAYKVSRAFLFVGAFGFILALLALVFHILFIVHLGDWNDKFDDEIVFMNYPSMILSIVLLVLFIIYAISVFLKVGSWFRAPTQPALAAYQPPAAQMAPPQAPPPEQPPAPFPEEPPAYPPEGPPEPPTEEPPAPPPEEPPAPPPEVPPAPSPETPPAEPQEVPLPEQPQAPSEEMPEGQPPPRPPEPGE